LIAELSLTPNTLAAARADTQSWLGESEQGDKWIFCLTAAMIAA